MFATTGLYKTSAGHGQVGCEACHGPTHAEYPCATPNDNVQSVAIQGHEGTIAECNACHDRVPLTSDGGPHGLHTIGQEWVDHHGAAARTGSSRCVPCHGADGEGTFLSSTFGARSLRVNGRVLSLPARQVTGCAMCHGSSGPSWGRETR